MKLYQRSLFVFSKDLRLHDHPGLKQANDLSERLACVYFLSPYEFEPKSFSVCPMGKQRYEFLRQGLCDLRNSLNDIDHELHVFQEKVAPGLERIIEQNKIEAVFASRCAGTYENQVWVSLQKRQPNLKIHLVDSHTLFNIDQPDLSKSFYNSFSQFRRQAEKWPQPLPMATILSLPAAMPVATDSARINLDDNRSSALCITGGEQKGLEHLYDYFNGSYALQYKATRNALDGWENSSKFSYWLAQGSLSVRLILQELRQFESLHSNNESTEHLYMELLWREFFQWYSHFYGKQLFYFSGIQKKRPLTTFYPQAFRMWLEGHTEWPLVNACMNQLRTTGYMSNRGRQIVASCLLNELKVDWRAGAQAFEHYLLDYDVAANWGNWQYIAGVGADPRGGRHFNIEKQTQLYDPDNLFIDKWSGNSTASIHTVDAADWPVGSQK
ncbi:DASH family cryptochrome [Bermanella marisrubri]|uniref:Cryptochrome DASH n=1 Tax=Bermanella marisrubri TaxID=207949 RepID=Q1MZA5_9GAMM|nr:DASH family cryptochrome [Bermanella marisrubri]EAT11361.1 Deoxyribodipyrimidine photolyase [Oceanobacter sp. RED65] [Bermanella marisrubri]QIZ85253.1 DASH family cryptochrome [Bermanella marisrubri]